MRIIAGKYRGIPLASVGAGDKTAHLRPTTDRVRENIFNILSGGKYGDPLGESARVLDVFAGTGALGLEALSRGASAVTFIENGRVAKNLIKQNIKKLDVENACQLMTQDATQPSKNTSEPYDLLFLDPPYGKSLGLSAVNALAAKGWICESALIVLEDNQEIGELPQNCVLLGSKSYGNTTLSFLEYTT